MFVVHCREDIKLDGKSFWNNIFDSIWEGETKEREISWKRGKLWEWIRIEDEDRWGRGKKNGRSRRVLTTASIGSQVISAPMQKGKSITDTVASDTDDWRHIQFIHREIERRSVGPQLRLHGEWRVHFWYSRGGSTPFTLCNSYFKRTSISRTSIAFYPFSSQASFFFFFFVYFHAIFKICSILVLILRDIFAHFAKQRWI